MLTVSLVAEMEKDFCVFKVSLVAEMEFRKVMEY